MAGHIKVNTDQVSAIATNIDSLNTKLKDLLLTSQKTVQGLANSWQGEAAQATISSFNDFAAKYFDNYYKVIDNYVKFLRTNVEQGYFETETVNTNLADAFK